jgi:hypothetical protein
MSEHTVTHSWRIERLDCTPVKGELLDVVARIHWRLLGSDGTNTANLYGEIALPPASPGQFLPYPELDEETVVAWLKAAIDARASAGSDEPTVAQLESSVAGMVAAMAEPAVISMEVPWS